MLAPVLRPLDVVQHTLLGPTVVEAQAPVVALGLRHADVGPVVEVVGLEEVAPPATALGGVQVVDGARVVPGPAGRRPVALGALVQAARPPRVVQGGLLALVLRHT